MPDYDTMSDEQLRLAVAERLGWTRLRHGWLLDAGRQQPVSFGVPPGGVVESGEDDDLVPNWPTDIAAAWELVERMDSMSDYDGVCVESGSKWGWECYLLSYEGDAVHAAAPTAPRAICVAYLKATAPAAKGVE